MKVLAYQGISWVSKAIRWQTRSKYSHIAIELDDSSMIEAWHKGGVLHRDSFSQGHTVGTVVDVYSIDCEFNQCHVEQFLMLQLGRKYDFRSVFRFLSRRTVRSNGKWFCSELVSAAFLAGGCRLLNGKSSLHSPRDIAMSPLLSLQDTRIVAAA